MTSKWQERSVSLQWCGNRLGPNERDANEPGPTNLIRTNLIHGSPRATPSRNDDRSIMTMTSEDILAHPGLDQSVRSQAQALLSIQESAPRLASVFATQQRWLMSHAALAEYFRSEAGKAGSGLLSERFLEIVERENIASRNTAAAFIKEMLRYDMVRVVPNNVGRRRRAIEPAPAVLAALHGWPALHFAALARLAGGARLTRLNGDLAFP